VKRAVKKRRAEGEAMMRWRIKRTDWIMLVILMLLALLGYYFGVIGPAPGLGALTNGCCTGSPNGGGGEPCYSGMAPWGRLKGEA
jgi:hypothetical protein